jgi:response regulator of citrate/malate metabolism
MEKDVERRRNREVMAELYRLSKQKLEKRELDPKEEVKIPKLTKQLEISTSLLTKGVIPQTTSSLMDAITSLHSEEQPNPSAEKLSKAEITRITSRLYEVVNRNNNM